MSWRNEELRGRVWQDCQYYDTSVQTNVRFTRPSTAGGKQLLLQSVNDPELLEFVKFFESGPYTPAPGVTCRHSTSATT